MPEKQYANQGEVIMGSTNIHGAASIHSVWHNQIAGGCCMPQYSAGHQVTTVQPHLSYMIQGTAKTLHSKEVKPARQTLDARSFCKRQPNGLPYRSIRSPDNVAKSQRTAGAKQCSLDEYNVCQVLKPTDVESNKEMTYEQYISNENEDVITMKSKHNLQVMGDDNMSDSPPGVTFKEFESDLEGTDKDSCRALEVMAHGLEARTKETDEDPSLSSALETVSGDKKSKMDIIVTTSQIQEGDEYSKTKEHSDVSTSMKELMPEQEPSMSSLSPPSSLSSQVWRLETSEDDDSHSETSQSSKNHHKGEPEALDYKYSYLYGNLTDQQNNTETHVLQSYNFVPQKLDTPHDESAKISKLTKRNFNDNKARSTPLFVSGQKANPTNSRKSENLRIFEATESQRISRTDRYVRYLLWKENTARSRERLANIYTPKPWKPAF